MSFWSKRELHICKKKKNGNALEIFWYLKLKDKFRKTLRPRYAKIRLHLGYIFHDCCLSDSNLISEIYGILLMTT